MRLSTLALASALTASAAWAQSSTATYRVTFESTWSQSSHPIDWPGASAHYSPLVGGAHQTAGTMWSAGGIATPGMEQMAETGGTSVLRSELNAVSPGEVSEVFTGPALASSPGSVSMEITVDADHPLVSLVTMVAPSPDWFLGVDSYDLLGDDGWTQDATADLQVWDAGTDSGASYASPNSDTMPREPIAISDAAPFASETVLGTFRFELLSVVDSDPAPRAFSLGQVAPQPTRGRARLAVTMEQAADVSVRIVDVLGREVARRDARLGAGVQHVELPSAALAAGTYVVRITAGDASETRRLTVAR